MLKLHYKIAHALDECLANLEFDEAPTAPPRRRRTSQLMKQKSVKTTGLHFSKLQEAKRKQAESDTTSSDSTDSGGYMSDDEHEKGGFDGVDCAFGPGRRPSFFSDGKGGEGSQS